MLPAPTNQEVNKWPFLLAILNQSPTPTFAFESIRDAQGIIHDFRATFANRAAEQISHLSFAQMQQATLRQTYPSAVSTGLLDLLIDLVDSGAEKRNEFYVDYLDLWVDASVTRLNDGFVATLLDITPRKRVEASQTEQDRRMESVLNASMNGIITYEAIRSPAPNQQPGAIVDFRFQTSNRVAMQVLSLTESPLGNTMLTLFPVNIAPPIFDMYVQVVETGKPARFETAYKANGVDGWYDVAVVKLGDGFVITFNDQTHLKRSEQAQQQQAAFVRTLLDGALNGVMSYDAVYDAAGEVIDLQILSVNRAAEKYLRMPEAELIGRNLLDLYPQNLEMGLFAMYKRVLSTKQAERMEAHLFTGETDIWLDLAATPRDGKGLVVSFMDITEHKQAQQQTDILIEELRKSNTNLEQFAYVASHDLQEPLRKVTAFGDMLRNQYAPVLGETGADLIGRMQSAALRMQTLIQDLLTFSRAASNQDAFGPIDLNQVLANVLTDLDTLLTDKGARTEIDPLPTLTGSALQLNQLFQNLLSNALKFTRAGTAPLIRVTCARITGAVAGELIPNAGQYKTYHRIEVIDNGIGFDPQYARRIFQLFQRLHTRSQYAGTGIGLSIVQKVIDNHQGYIQAEGTPGSGAKFTILLPAESAT